MTAAGGGAAGPRRASPVVAECLVYFGFGMPIAMLGVAWPQLRDAFGRSNGELGVLAVAYGLGRLTTSGTSGLVLRKAAFGTATVAASVALGVASLLVVASPNWAALVAAVLVVGLVSGLLDSLGARFLAARRSIGSAGLITGSYGVGATVGPAFVALSGSWTASYVAAGAVALAAGLAVRALPIAWPEELAHPSRAAGAARPERTRIERLPLALSLALFFVFVGIEVTAGQWTAPLLEDARHVDHRLAGLTVSAFWAGVTLGRLFLARLRLTPTLLVGASAVLLGLLVGAAVLPRPLVLPVMFLAGLALSPMTPTLFAQTADRVGAAQAQRVSGWQLVSANVAGIGLPALTGVLVGAATAFAPTLVLGAVAAAGVVLLAAVYRRPARPHPPVDLAPPSPADL